MVDILMGTLGNLPTAIRNQGTLYGSRDGTPWSCRAQPNQIYRDRLRFRQIAVKHPRLGNRPLLLERRVPGRKSVIAVADCRFQSRLHWQIPMAPFMPLGSRNGRAGECWV